MDSIPSNPQAIPKQKPGNHPLHMCGHSGVPLACLAQTSGVRISAVATAPVRLHGDSLLRIPFKPGQEMLAKA